MKDTYVPKIGEMYYYPNPIMPDLINNAEFFDNNISKHRADCGLCYPPTDEGYISAIVHANAILGVCNPESMTVKAFKDSSGSVTLHQNKKQIAHYSSSSSNKPTKRNKSIEIGCFSFKLEWI
jgi:hypothetical protein